MIKTLPANLLCFSHLRWDFVYQRPQHLISRFAKHQTVYFLEESVFDARGTAQLSFARRDGNIHILVPHLPEGVNEQQKNRLLSGLLDRFLESKDLEDFAFWYYSPMPLLFSDKHIPKLTIYDCMDELSAFKNASGEISVMEKKLMGKADLVFTGGRSLYEAKRHQHSNIHLFPSSIDKAHFQKARSNKQQPVDQKDIQGVKLGFYGVIDERFDIELIKGIADARSDWQIILIGPIVKIDPVTLPANANIHYLGQKRYEELPAYLSGWDIALIPFAINESTKFISPTKTPEYLAAGIPVISTPVKDVVDPYGKEKLVHIGANALEFVSAVKQELSAKNKIQWLARTDNFLAVMSWDITADNMLTLVKKHLASSFSIAS